MQDASPLWDIEPAPSPDALDTIDAPSPPLSKNALKKALRTRKAPNSKTKKARQRALARSLFDSDAPLAFDTLDLDSITPEDLAKMDGAMASRIKDKMDVMSRTIEGREVHEGWMRGAIEMAELALRSDETPVGCVFVHDGKIIARGMNGTNATLNGTRHAEFVALSQIIAKYPLSILQQTDLYVTVEPCIMCASALRQFRIRAVYFGCLNERFGGCGGVMRLNSDLPSIDPPYSVYGGIFREEAIMLLRRFYVQENEKGLSDPTLDRPIHLAPEPKPKKNRELKTEILPVEVAHSGNPPLAPAPQATKSTDSIPTVASLTSAASTPTNGQAPSISAASTRAGQAPAHLVAVPRVLQAAPSPHEPSSVVVSPPPNTPADGEVVAKKNGVGGLVEKVREIMLADTDGQQKSTNGGSEKQQEHHRSKLSDGVQTSIGSKGKEREKAMAD
ncbi:hypothetical protein CAC42_3307 [Sphaceloma murrayae]|uniref:tRNA(adenine(34)) deaminase n=1 Tax=Sphaceloma murrayae TaxID=2082308 RepID=A0A2K1QFG9_9PEZI|nr:hypothetical protein CAC42_3307 [Sphaceloma murrayae]